MVANGANESPRRTQREAARENGETAESDIAKAASASTEEFIEDYMQPSDGWTQWTHPKSGTQYTLAAKQPAELTDDEMKQCFEILEEMSGPDYKKSRGGWHPDAKKEEMASEGLRYILVTKQEEKEEDEEKGIQRRAIQGFASFMPTFEDGHPVIYCYEMQLGTELQGAGLGRVLMDLVLSTANHTPSVVKTMLTCFVSNSGARRFYERMGFEVDESSPRDRKLRSGKVVTSDYVILSCRIKKGLRQPDEGRSV